MYLVIVSRESLEGDVVVEILILVEGQLDLWMKFSILTPGISFLAWFFLLWFLCLFFGRAVRLERIQFFNQGLNLGPRQGKCKVLTNGCCPVAHLCLTLCSPMDRSTPGFPVLHYLLELLKFTSIELVMLSNHLILIFSNELALRIKWPKYWSFSFSLSP